MIDYAVYQEAKSHTKIDDRLDYVEIDHRTKKCKAYLERELFEAGNIDSLGEE
jgi:hypothetical protein